MVISSYISFAWFVLIIINFVSGFPESSIFLALVSPEFIEPSNIILLFSNTVPIKIYLNADLNKERIILENKDKAGVYQFINLLTGESYVGSSTNLSRRLRQYYSYSHISSKTRGKSIVCSSILKNGYSNFSLTILEYSEIKDIINREQFYIDVIVPTMNILQVAGNSLGYNHTKETREKIRKAVNGREHTEETKTLMSKSKIGGGNPMYGKIGENSPNFGKSRSSDTRAKMSIIKGGGTIFVYDSDGSLVNSFESARKAAEELNCDHKTILRYAKSGELFRDQWILSTFLK